MHVGHSTRGRKYISSMKGQGKPSKAQVAEYYRQMFLIRCFEERCAEEYTKGNIRGFLHLYIGEEAIAVGAISALKKQDYIILQLIEII